MEKRNPNQARILGVIEAKRLIVAASLAGTLSLWYLFSSQSGNSVAAVHATPTPTEAAASQDLSTSGLTINFPPLPTLVPTLQDTLGQALTQKLPAQPPPAIVLQPAAQQPSKIIIAGAKPPSASAPAPVARSRSSH